MQKEVTQVHNINADELISELLKEFKKLIQGADFGNQKTEELLTRKEMAALLSISLPTLRSYVKRGLIKELRIGARVLYNKSDVLESFLKKVAN